MKNKNKKHPAKAFHCVMVNNLETQSSNQKSCLGRTQKKLDRNEK